MKKRKVVDRISELTKSQRKTVDVVATSLVFLIVFVIGFSYEYFSVDYLKKEKADNIYLFVFMIPSFVIGKLISNFIIGKYVITRLLEKNENKEQP